MASYRPPAINTLLTTMYVYNVLCRTSDSYLAGERGWGWIHFRSIGLSERGRVLRVYRRSRDRTHCLRLIYATANGPLGRTYKPRPTSLEGYHSRRHCRSCSVEQPILLPRGYTRAFKYYIQCTRAYDYIVQVYTHNILCVRNMLLGRPRREYRPERLDFYRPSSRSAAATRSKPPPHGNTTSSSSSSSVVH